MLLASFECKKKTIKFQLKKEDEEVEEEKKEV